MPENVNHPNHYFANSGIEVIDAIEAWNLNFSRGNAIKYIARAGVKNPDKEIEDLQKAVWYINREIERLQNGE
jgi:formylmethanofuran dehydrogenase subunit A